MDKQELKQRIESLSNEVDVSFVTACRMYRSISAQNGDVEVVHMIPELEKEYTDAIRLKRRKQMVYRDINEQMNKLLDAHYELNKLWLENGDMNSILELGYPYQSCFNELYSDVQQWVYSFNELNNVIQNQ